jgi:hypothetical protein
MRSQRWYWLVNDYIRGLAGTMSTLRDKIPNVVLAGRVHIRAPAGTICRYRYKIPKMVPAGQ